MLNISKNFLKAIIEATPNAIYLKNEQGKYIMINEKGASSVGKTINDFIGKTDAEVFPPELANTVMELDRKVFAGNNHNGEEKVSDDLYFYSHKFTITDEDTGERLLVGISTDISDIKNTEKELERAKLKAEEASNHKSVFLQNMSHELRTPLNAIIGFSSILTGESGIEINKVDDSYFDYAKLINSSGVHLLAIINDLLDLSKVEAGEQDFTESDIDIKYVIETCMQTLAGIAKDKNITITEDFTDHNITIKGDEKIMRQMIYNLLSNAIKYSNEDSETTVKLYVTGERGVDVSIIDDGIGMSEEDLTTAMIPFRRSSHVKTSDISGTGLGLPIVDAFVKLFQGSLEIKSDHGVGTKATLHFPAERSVIT